MPISINGTGSITGLSAGGLPDASITADDIASNAVTTAKVNDAAITYGKLSTSATESDNVAKRTAKAWVNFNGTGTPAVTRDFQVDSITDNGIGDYTINFTSGALTTSSYCVVSSAEAESGINVSHMRCASVYGGTKSTSSVRIRCGGLANATDFIDLPAVFIATFE